MRQHCQCLSSRRCLSSRLAAAVPRALARLLFPPDSCCVTFVLSSTEVTPKVPVDPVTQTQLPMPELSTPLLQHRSARRRFVFPTTHLLPQPLRVTRVTKRCRIPQGKILFREQIFTASTKWGRVRGSLPRLGGQGGRGALVSVAATCAAASLHFGLVAEAGELFQQQLSDNFHQ